MNSETPVRIEILANSNLCKCLKAIKCSESGVETLQIFFITMRCTRSAYLHFLFTLTVLKGSESYSQAEETL